MASNVGKIASAARELHQNWEMRKNEVNRQIESYNRVLDDVIPDRNERNDY
jgi:hypothetical protein